MVAVSFSVMSLDGVCRIIVNSKFGISRKMLRKFRNFAIRRQDKSMKCLKDSNSYFLRPTHYWHLRIYGRCPRSKQTLL